jgi:hypothetical protein
MFRWSQNVAKCYVYLSDVPTRKRQASDRLSEYTWELAFRSSRWFTRGWALQELLAPVQIRLSSSPKNEMLRTVVMRHNILDLEGGSLASYIDTQNAFLSVHSAAPQLPIT